MISFEGKAGLVTGAGSGIGRASALKFAELGAGVGVLDVNEDGARETVRQIEEAGGKAIAVVVDVGDEDSVAAAVQQVVAEYGRLDFAHNNAGIMDANGLLQDVDTAEWDRVVRVNLTGVFLCMKHELPHLVAAGRGAIVNTASTAGLNAVEVMPAYVATKHGVVGLSKAVAIDYGHLNVRVNALCPGATMTPLLESYAVDQEGLDVRVAAIPLKRLGRPEELANAAAWLCSDAASFVTGVAFPVAGGRRA